MIGKFILNLTGATEKITGQTFSKNVTVDIFPDLTKWKSFVAEVKKVENDPVELDVYLREHGLGDIENLKAYIKEKGADNLKKDSVNELITQQNYKNLANAAHGYKGVTNAISEYNKIIATGSGNQEQFLKAVSLTNPQLAKAMQNYNTGSMNMRNYATSLITAKAGTVALQVATTALNAAISFGLSLAIQGAIELIITAINKTSELSDKAEEVGSNLQSSGDDIDSYKEKIAELQKTINDSGSSVEEIGTAREELMKIQDELIDKFGTEKSTIDIVTDSINNQADALDNLKLKKYQQAKSEYNEKSIPEKALDWFANLHVNAGHDLANIFHRFFNEPSEEYEDVQTNLEQMADEMEHQEITIPITTDTKVNDLLRQAGFSEVDGEFSINGSAYDVQDKLSKMKELTDGYKVGDDFTKALEDESAAIDELIAKNDELYKQHVLYDEILAKDSKKGYDEYYNQLNQAAEDFNAAKESGNEQDIERAATTYSDVLKKATQEAKDNNDFDVAEYFEEMYPTIQEEVGKWKFTVDFEANTDNVQNDLNAALKKLDGMSVEDINNFNVNTATPEQIEGYAALERLANDKYNMSMEDFTKLLQEMGKLKYEKQEELIKQFGEDNINKLSKEDLEIAYKIENVGNMTFEELQDAIRDFKKNSYVSFKVSWKGLKSDAKEKLLEVAEAGELTAKAFQGLEGATQLMQETGLSADTLAQKINNLVTSADQLSAMQTGITGISNILGKKKDNLSDSETANQGIDAGTLAGLPDDIKECKKEYTNFFNVLGNGSSTMAQCQDAANKLATAWVNSKNFLSKLNSKNKETYISSLKLMGVQNAEAVVNSALKNKVDETVSAKFDLVLATYDLSDGISKDECNSLSKEIGFLNNANDATRLYALQKILSNNSVLKTSDDIDNLIALCNQLNLTGQALKEYTKFKELAKEYQKYLDGEGQWDIIGMSKTKRALDAQIKKLQKVSTTKISTKISVDSSNVTNSDKKSNSSKKSKTEQQFDFLEIKINKLIDKATQAKEKIEELFNFKAKRNQIAKAIKETTTAINAEYKAAKRYQNYADKMAGGATKTSIEKVSGNVGDAIVKNAKQYVNKLKYVWGGTSLTNGADCSGFVQQIMKQYGVNLARTSKEQYATTKGQKIKDKSKLKKGDLVFFGNNGDASKIHHVGIYAGNGKFIDSPHTGAKVRVNNLATRSDFVGGIRTNATSSKSSVKTKRIKVKGVKQSTVDHYKKLIDNGTLGTEGLQKISNEKLKKALEEYQTWHEKAVSHLEKAKELEKEITSLRKQNLQLYVDDANNHLDVLSAEEDIATSAKRKNALEKSKLKWIKQSYDYQIKIAKKDKDSLTVAKLRAEKEKEILETRKQILQNSLDENSSKRDYLDAQYDNATLTEKNKLSNQRIKTYRSDDKAQDTYYQSVKSNEKSKAKSATTTATKTKSVSDKTMKRITAYINKGKKIPESLLKQIKRVDADLYNTLLKYNNNYADYSSVKKALKKSKVSKKTKKDILADLDNGKKISSSTLKSIQKKNPTLYKVATQWNKDDSKRKSTIKSVSNTKALTKSEKKKIKSLINSGKEIPSSLLNKVKKYDTSLYNKLYNYNQSVEELDDALLTKNTEKEKNKTNIANEVKEQFDNVSEVFDRKIADSSHNINRLNSSISWIETHGGQVTSSYYNKISEQTQKEADEAQEKVEKLQKALDDAVANGSIRVGTDDWYTMNKAIQEAKESVDDYNVSLEETKQKALEADRAIRQSARDRISMIADEAEFYKTIAGYQDQYDKNGNITDAGKVTLTMNATGMNTALELIKKNLEEKKLLDAQYNNGNGDIGYDTYMSQSKDIISTLQEQAESYYSLRDAIKSFIEDALNKQKEALDDMIDRYKKNLSYMKDLYDYQKNISQQTKSIALFEKRLAALQGDDSESARLRKQKLQKELSDSKQELQETEYDRYISDQEEILDNLASEFEDFIESQTENIETVINQLISELGSFKSDALKEMNSLAGKVGMTVSDELGSIVSDGHYSNTANDDSNVDKILDAIYNIDKNNRENSEDKVPDNMVDGADHTNDNQNTTTGTKTFDVNEFEKYILEHLERPNEKTTSNTINGYLKQNTGLTLSDDAIKELMSMIGATGGSDAIVAKILQTGVDKSLLKASNDKTETSNRINDSYDSKINYIKENAKGTKIEDAVDYIISHLDRNINDAAKRKINQSSKDYDPLMAYIYGKTGAIFHSSNYTKLGQLLGLNNIKNNSDSQMRLYRALRSAGFSKGGIVEKIQEATKKNGDDGICTVKRGEGILTPVQTDTIQRFAEVLSANSSLAALPTQLGVVPTIPPQNTTNRTVNMTGDMVFNLEKVNSPEDFIREVQHNTKFRNGVHAVIGDYLMGTNNANKYI